jgi:hypothetical protein
MRGECPSRALCSVESRAAFRNEKPAVDSVTLNYLPKNVAPEIDDVHGAGGSALSAPPQVRERSSAWTCPETPFGRISTSPTPSTHDRDSIGVKWNAHDDNDDQLIYSVYYRGDGETRWLLLKDNSPTKPIPSTPACCPTAATRHESRGFRRAFAFSRRGPDRGTGKPRFEVDTTPPRIENLAASVEGAQIHVHFRAVDGFSPSSAPSIPSTPANGNMSTRSASSPTRRSKTTTSWLFSPRGTLAGATLHRSMWSSSASSTSTTTWARPRPC